MTRFFDFPQNYYFSIYSEGAKKLHVSPHQVSFTANARCEYQTTAFTVTACTEWEVRCHGFGLCIMLLRQLCAVLSLLDISQDSKLAELISAVQHCFHRWHSETKMRRRIARNPPFYILRLSSQFQISFWRLSIVLLTGSNWPANNLISLMRLRVFRTVPAAQCTSRATECKYVSRGVRCTRFTCT